jgi:hypothetical protein
MSKSIKPLSLSLHKGTYFLPNIQIYCQESQESQESQETTYQNTKNHPKNALI